MSKKVRTLFEFNMQEKTNEKCPKCSTKMEYQTIVKNTRRYIETRYICKNCSYNTPYLHLEL